MDNQINTIKNKHSRIKRQIQIFVLNSSINQAKIYVFFLLFQCFAIFLGNYFRQIQGAVVLLFVSLICSYIYNRKYNPLLLTNKEFHKIQNRAIIKLLLLEFEASYGDKTDLNYILMLFFELQFKFNLYNDTHKKKQFMQQNIQLYKYLEYHENLMKLFVHMAEQAIKLYELCVNLEQKQELFRVYILPIYFYLNNVQKYRKQGKQIKDLLFQFQQIKEVQYYEINQKYLQDVKQFRMLQYERANINKILTSYFNELTIDEIKDIKNKKSNTVLSIFQKHIYMNNIQDRKPNQKVKIQKVKSKHLNIMEHSQIQNIQNIQNFIWDYGYVQTHDSKADSEDNLEDLKMQNIQISKIIYNPEFANEKQQIQINNQINIQVNNIISNPEEPCKEYSASSIQSNKEISISQKMQQQISSYNQNNCYIKNPKNQTEVEMNEKFDLLYFHYTSPLSIWTQVLNKPEIQIYKQYTDGNPAVLVKAECNIQNATPLEIFEQIYDAEQRKRWDKVTLDFSVVDKISEDIDFIYFYVKAICVDNRDFLQKRIKRFNYPTKGAITILFYSVDNEIIRKKGKGWVRAHSYIAGYVITPLENGDSHLTILSQCNIKGAVPSWVVNMMAARAPKQWLDSMNKALEIAKEARQNSLNQRKHNVRSITCGL